VYLCIESMIRALAIRHRHRTHMLQLRILEQQLTRRNPRCGVDRESGKINLDTWEPDNNEAWIAYFR
jgi:hypothetical protein